MKVFMISEKAGTNMDGKNALLFNVLRDTRGILRLDFAFCDGSFVTTSAVDHALQSASDTILFITSSGSRYAVEFETEEELKISTLQNAIQYASAISSLKFTDIGKKILES